MSKRGQQRGEICVNMCKRGGRRGGPGFQPGFCVFILGFLYILRQQKKKSQGNSKNHCIVVVKAKESRGLSQVHILHADPQNGRGEGRRHLVPI